jgi:predicted ATPase/transcriptional regulator with XRE-family HTH domain
MDSQVTSRMNTIVSFGAWVKHRRRFLDLTQQELAGRVGCSLATIVKIESDERRPSRQIAELLAQHLEIPADQHDLFLKVARQEKGVDSLKTFPSPVFNPIQEEPVIGSQPLPGNLPVSPTTLIGREHETAMIGRQLLDPACRMLTLTGPGGVGKTRLAIEAGHQLEAHFPDGVFFVSMAGVGMSESILPTIAESIGLTFSGPAGQLLQASTYLRTKQTLLVIDNMEHLIEAGSLLGELLQNTQQVKMLVTSREPLRLQWEWIFEVHGLPVPEEKGDNLENNSASLLFIQRARQASQKFSLQENDADALVRICKLVGGLPLAIELAASWVRILSCKEIAQELERSLDLLETRKHDVPQRHRSIRAVFDHSWKLLTGEERLVLMRLSVFQGGFTREAAFSAAGASIPMLSSLVDKSLLRHINTPDRYDLHELIRQYTYAQLQADPAEELQASEKHSIYYASWIAALETPFKSARQAYTSQLIRSETSNWLAGWHRAVAHGRLELLRKMSPCLNWYFEVHGYYDEALSVFNAALERFRASGSPASLQGAEERSAFAGLVDQVGWFEFRKGNVEQGAALLAESLEIAREYNDPEILYYIYGNWGYLALMQGDISEASRLTTESLEYARALHSPWHTAIPISVLGIVAFQQGNLSEAYQQLNESLSLWRSVGDPRGLVFCLLYMGMAALAMNDIPTARSILEESNTIAEANMDRWAHALGLDLLGMASLYQDQPEEALVCFKQSSALSKEIGDQLNGTQTLIHMGQAYAALQSYSEAKQLFLKAYAAARQAKWMPILLNALVSYAELPDTLPPETKMVVALSVIQHAAVTPNLRARSEQLRDEMIACLTAEQVEQAEKIAKVRSPEDWANEILI